MMGIKPNNEICVNTLDHGCICGYLAFDLAELNRRAQVDGFMKNCLVYYGNIMCCDTGILYMFFRDAENSKNYLYEV